MVMLQVLSWQKVLQWADVKFERWPAYNAGNSYRRPKKRKHVIFQSSFLPGPEVDKPLYAGLADALFVEPWVELLLKGSGREPYAKKERLMPLVRLLGEINQRGEEFQKAMMTTLALGGGDALNLWLASEGIWILPK